MEDVYFKTMNEFDSEALSKIIYLLAESEDKTSSFKNSTDVYDFLDDYMEKNKKTYKDIFTEIADDKGTTKRQDVKSFIINEYERSYKELSREGNSKSSRARISKIQGIDDLVKNIKLANTLKELAFAIEPLAYYFSMKPEEFWNGETNMIRMLDDFKMQIVLQEAVTDKQIV